MVKRPIVTFRDDGSAYLYIGKEQEKNFVLQNPIPLNEANVYKIFAQYNIGTAAPILFSELQRILLLSRSIFKMQSELQSSLRFKKLFRRCEVVRKAEFIDILR